MIEIQLLKKIVLFLSVASIAFCLQAGGGVILLLPVLYAMCYRFLVPKNTICGGGFLIMTLVLSIRYLLYPPIYLNGNNTGEAMSNIAVFVMGFEMLVIFITIYFFYRNRSKQPDIQDIYFDTKINGTVPLLLTVLLLVFILSGQNVVGSYTFIWNYKDTFDEINIQSYVGVKIFEWFQMFLVVSLLSVFYRSYVKGRRYAYFFSILVLMGCCLYSNGNGRLSVLIPGVTAASMMYKMFKEKSKKAILIMCAVLFVVLLFLSLYKVFRSDDVDVDDSADMFSDFFIDIYFSGVGNMIAGLRAYVMYGQSLGTLITDLGKNTMGIGGLFQGQTSTEMFNYAYYMSYVSYDQICPTLVNGLLYFGPFGCWITTVVMVFFVCYCDCKWANTSDMQYAYLYAFVPIMVGWAVPGSFNHFIINTFNVFLPLLFLINLNKRIKLQ